MKAHEILGEMTLREKIGQTFVQYYQGYNDLPEHLIEMNKKNELGGIIYFSGNNVRNLNQLKEMGENIQAHSADNRFNLPFFLTIDQEGGQLTAIHKGTTMFPGNMALGFANDEEMAYQQGRHSGKELRYAGIDICYAPVLDVSYDRVNGVAVVDNRMYSDKPEVVAAMGMRYVQGLQEEGIIACGKHFPGMRITQEDTHFEADRHPGDMQRLIDVELKPFQTAIDGGLECVMMHHGIFDALDPELPASLSGKVINHLRKNMGFEGLIITDDLVMKSILDEFGEKESLVLAMNAGCDILMSTCAGPWYVDFMEACVKEGRISEERINDACLRVLTHKEKHKSQLTNREKTFNKEEGDQLAYEIARKSLINYKSEPGMFPIKLEDKQKLGIVMGNPARLVMSDAINLYDTLSIEETVKNRINHKDVKEAIMPWQPAYMEMVSVGDIAIISDIVIFTTVNAYHFEKQIETIKYIRQFCPDKIIIGVASRSPEDAPLLAKYCDAVIITGGLSQVTLDALVDAIFKDGEFEFNDAKKLFDKE